MKFEKFILFRPDNCKLNLDIMVNLDLKFYDHNNFSVFNDIRAGVEIEDIDMRTADFLNKFTDPEILYLIHVGDEESKFIITFNYFRSINKISNKKFIFILVGTKSTIGGIGICLDTHITSFGQLSKIIKNGIDGWVVDNLSEDIKIYFDELKMKLNA